MRGLWCTLGPSSLNEKVIPRLEEIGATLFRLNLSHTDPESLSETLEFVRELSRVPICLDTEGAQIRTGALSADRIRVRRHAVIEFPPEPLSGDESRFNLYPASVIDELAVGDIVRVDSDVLVQVVDGLGRDGVRARVLNGGEIGQNRAVTVLGREIEMPPLTDKDRRCLDIGREAGVRHVALSFAHRAADVEEIRALAGEDATVISKIECRSGLENLPEITAASDALLLDRGDLSREVDLEKMPLVQKDVIRYANDRLVDVYVATNLMESMVAAPAPTRAEVNDVFNTLLDGADGLVLAGETAIGAHPVGAALMVRRIAEEYEETRRWHGGRSYPETAPRLVEPHGGRLVDRAGEEAERAELAELETVWATFENIVDCVQIARGTYSPLTGFMTAEELKSVLDTNRLPDGIVWTLPIFLRVTDQTASRIAAGDRVALKDPYGVIRATVDVSEVFSFDVDEFARKAFGTTSRRHPGVWRLVTAGERFVAGDVTLIHGDADAAARYDLGPAQTRQMFAQLGWDSVAGYHSREPLRRVPARGELTAAASIPADGLYISFPTSGATSGGAEEAESSDPEVVVSILDAAMAQTEDRSLRTGRREMVGGLSTYPRFCGPREDVFTTLCHKNLGCSHFLVGREPGREDHPDGETSTRRLFDELGDIGIVPVFGAPGDDDT